MKYTIINSIILDGSLNMEPKKGLNILVEDGIISKIGNFDPIGKVVDLNGLYLMPGMINLHTHLPATGKVYAKKKTSDLKGLVKFLLSNGLTRQVALSICKKNAQMELKSGTTTIRCVGGLGHIDSKLKKKIENGCLGPRLVVADAAICSPGGHMDGTVSIAAHNNEEAIKLIDDNAKHGVDLIKIMITGGVMDSVEIGHPGVLKMQPDMIKACCDEAHKLGLKVAAHIEGEEGIKQAILNGVDSIEHSAKVDDEILNMLAERHGCIVPTFSPAVPLSYTDPETNGYGIVGKANSEALLAGMIETGKKCLEKGILVGIGNDTGSPFTTHYDFYRELLYFVKYLEVSNNFALHTVTEVNAKIAGLENITGAVKEGLSADFVVTKENPIDDLHTLKNPEYVFIKGKYLKQPKNKRYENVEETLNNIEKNL